MEKSGEEAELDDSEVGIHDGTRDGDLCGAKKFTLSACQQRTLFPVDFRSPYVVYLLEELMQ